MPMFISLEILFLKSDLRKKGGEIKEE